MALQEGADHVFAGLAEHQVALLDVFILQRNVLGRGSGRCDGIGIRNADIVRLGIGQRCGAHGDLKAIDLVNTDILPVKINRSVDLAHCAATRVVVLIIELNLVDLGSAALHLVAIGAVLRIRNVLQSQRNILDLVGGNHIAIVIRQLNIHSRAVNGITGHKGISAAAQLRFAGLHSRIEGAAHSRAEPAEIIALSGGDLVFAQICVRYVAVIRPDNGVVIRMIHA